MSIVLIINFRRLEEISDPFLKEKWKMTEANIKSEIKHVVQIYDVCTSIKNDNFDYSKKQVEEVNNKKNENILIIPVNDKEKKHKIPNIQHFGGKMPFNNDDPVDIFKKDEGNGNIYHDEKDDYRNLRKDNKPKENNDIDNNYVVYKKPEKINNIVEKKDPMVWDPPEEKIEKKSNYV